MLMILIFTMTGERLPNRLVLQGDRSMRNRDSIPLTALGRLV